MSVLQETGPAAPGARRARYARYLPSVGFMRFVLRRFAAMILMLLGVTVVAWALTNVVPGDPAATSLGPVGSLDPKLVEFYQHKYGLDTSLPEQYWLYLKNLMHGDLGNSFSTNRPVTTDLRQFVPATAELAVLACFFGCLIGITLGTWAALRREALPDQALRVVSLAGLSAPQFWLALIVLYFFFFKWGLAPGGGRLTPGVSAPPHTTGAYTIDSLIHGQWSTFKDAIWHMMLPALVLVLVIVGYVTRYTRSAVLEVVSEDYVRAARAKGLPEHTVVVRYVLRAAAPAVITVLGLVFAFVLAGSVFVESVYGYTGLGLYAFHGATSLDIPAITGTLLFVATVYIVLNFIVDVLYGLIDPRIRIT